jgi:hypothetical protein
MSQSTTTKVAQVIGKPTGEAITTIESIYCGTRYVT